MNPTPPESLTHPVLGELRWDEQVGGYVGRIGDSSGEGFEVWVSPDENHSATIEAALQLASRAAECELLLRRAAVRHELLDLFHDSWIQEGESELTEEQLAKRLTLYRLIVSPKSKFPIILSYDDGHLFGGHTIEVLADDEFRILDVMLIG